MKTTTFLLIFSFLIFSSEIVLAGTYSGGTGTATDPFKISKLTDLAEISKNKTDWGKSFIQTANIDATETGGFSYNNGNGFDPIARSAQFTGSYNGQNFKITGITIFQRDSLHVGIFGQSAGAKFSNIKIVDCDITGGERTGALPGYGFQTTISNVTVSGRISGSGNNKGGLLGVAHDATTLTNCQTNISVSGTQGVGGLVGQIWDGIVITYCSATGDVTGTDRAVGGLIGQAGGGTQISKISKCFATGSASAVYYTGGFIGQTLNSEGTIANCYSTGASTSTQFAGGFLGQGWSTQITMTNCFSTGAVSGGASGAFAAQSNASITNCFFDKQTSIPNATDVFATGLSTNSFKTKASFPGWDFVAVWTEMPTGRPVLKTQQEAPAGVGSVFKNDDFVVYPNPSTDYIQFKGLNPQQETTIYSISGMKVMEFKYSNNRIDVSRLSNGIYIIENGNCQTRFIKK